MSGDAKKTNTGGLLNSIGAADPSESYQRALGRLTIHFSLLHFVLERLSWKLWGLSVRSRSIYAVEGVSRTPC